MTVIDSNFTGKSHNAVIIFADLTCSFRLPVVALTQNFIFLYLAVLFNFTSCSTAQLTFTGVILYIFYLKLF